VTPWPYRSVRRASKRSVGDRVADGKQGRSSWHACCDGTALLQGVEATGLAGAAEGLAQRCAPAAPGGGRAPLPASAAVGRCVGNCLPSDYPGHAQRLAAGPLHVLRPGCGHGAALRAKLPGPRDVLGQLLAPACCGHHRPLFFFVLMVCRCGAVVVTLDILATGAFVFIYIFWFFFFFFVIFFLPVTPPLGAHEGPSPLLELVQPPVSPGRCRCRALVEVPQRPAQKILGALAWARAAISCLVSTISRLFRPREFSCWHSTQAARRSLLEGLPHPWSALSDFGPPARIHAGKLGIAGLFSHSTILPSVMVRAQGRA